MSKGKKILIAVVAVVVALLIVVDVAGSAYLVNYAIGRAGDGGDRNVEEVVFVEEETDENAARIEAERTAQKALTDAFLEQVAPINVSITAVDGICLAGVAYEHDASSATPSATSATSDGAIASTSNRWVIVVHGYRSSNESDYVLAMAQHYYDAGFNVLTPDLRASGDSEGDYVGMGWLDRLDILTWIDWIVDQDPDAQIVIHGVSMGAATTMMVAGEPTPEAVVAFVEDCGYTSVWDVFSNELTLRFGLPEFPLLHTASLVSSIMAGYSFQEASALEAVERSDKPMLFIHGTADDFIPFDMMGVLFDAKTTGDKEMLISEGAGHAEAMYELADTYWDTVFAFVNQYMEE